ncbi:N-acetylmuramoyl-L-alanine amidase [Rummeliibacillus stabekisii]|uniref:N-acetylmuramoyl-L-alanine amidase n=1 Tax=Rummeliibacillus TaxID=648802 RepID=UPI001238E678|nr:MULTISPECIES: N-acetylmuramoyl-L-alanine amidase [Rummeliibacillus]MCM3317729.1 N-acetylmuramoyl-L-alanine amidase [Rummeliibacillus stabekisii]
MKRWMIWSVVLVACIFIVVYETKASNRGFFISETLGGVKIALDAGHGGIDGGASTDKLIEKNVTLAITKEVEKLLKKKGATVYMTRSKNDDVIAEHTPKAEFNTLRERKKQDIFLREKLVNKEKPDLFLSIHANAIPETKWRGAQVFYHANGHPAGELLANSIQDSIKENLKNTEREALAIKQVYLLKKVKMPAVLVETGFLSNPEEAELLSSPDYQRKMAEAIVDGIERYSESSIE